MCLSSRSPITKRVAIPGLRAGNGSRRGGNKPGPARDYSLKYSRSPPKTTSSLRLALVAVERCDLTIDPIPVNLAGQLHQLVLQIDDLIEPGPKQITCCLRLFRSHRALRPMRRPNQTRLLKGIPKMKLQASGASARKACNLKSCPARRTDSHSMA
jgi:hypothetical protein